MKLTEGQKKFIMATLSGELPDHWSETQCSPMDVNYHLMPIDFVTLQHFRGVIISYKEKYERPLVVHITRLMSGILAEGLVYHSDENPSDLSVTDNAYGAKVIIHDVIRDGQ